MFRIFRGKRGQNLAEYAILIGLVVAAAIAMQTYVRRGLQARVKGAMDIFMNQSQNATGCITQFEPSYMDTRFTTEQNETTQEAIEPGSYTRDVWSTVNRTGTQNITYTEESLP